jgi:hypothetical protein
MASRDMTEHFAHKPFAVTAAEALRKDHEIQQKTIIALFRPGVPTERISTRCQNLKSLYLKGL